MARQIQLRRGTTSQTASFTGALAEITVDTDKDVVVVHDGSTAGGHPLTKTSTLGTAATTAATDYATAAQGATADAALPKAGGAMTGAITTNSTFDGVDIATRDAVLTSTTTTANAALPKAGGTMSGDIDGNGSKVLFANVYSAIGDLPSASTYHGMFAHVHATGKGYFAHAGAWVELANDADKLNLSGGAMTGAVTTNSTFDGRDVATDGTKLDTVETNADVTDATNVTAAGALMDSEVTNLAEIKAFSASDYATASQGTLAANALPKSGGAMTGAITTNSTFDGVDIAARDAVLTSTTTTAAAALPKAGGSMTGDLTVGGEVIAESYNETYVAVTSTSNATTVSCEAGNTFSHTLTQNTTFTFSNPPASGVGYTMSIEIIQDSGASGYTVAWPSSVDWPAATAPTLTATASAKDVFIFTTRDGGSTWYGFTAGQAIA